MTDVENTLMEETMIGREVLDGSTLEDEVHGCATMIFLFLLFRDKYTLVFRDRR